MAGGGELMAGKIPAISLAGGGGSGGEKQKGFKGYL